MIQMASGAMGMCDARGGMHGRLFGITGRRLFSCALAHA